MFLFYYEFIAFVEFKHIDYPLRVLLLCVEVDGVVRVAGEIELAALIPRDAIGAQDGVGIIFYVGVRGQTL